MTDNVLESGEEGYKKELKDPLFAGGIIAVTAAWTMILLSWRSVRRFLYEFFRITHVVLAIVVLIAYHR